MASHEENWRRGGSPEQLGQFFEEERRGGRLTRPGVLVRSRCVRGWWVFVVFGVGHLLVHTAKDLDLPGMSCLTFTNSIPW